MHDQPEQFRQFARRRIYAEPVPGVSAPLKILVRGGKRGVGTTSVAVNLAVGLATHGKRVVLVDADQRSADATHLCRIDGRDSIANVLAGSRTVHEVLQRGPAGVQILPGAEASYGLPDSSLSAQQRLLRELAALHRHVDLVVFDAGAGSIEPMRSLWLSADLMLLVTVEDVVSIMDSYATLKSLAATGPAPPRIRTIVNQATNEQSADEVHRRIIEAGHRFLGLELTAAASLTSDPAVSQAAVTRESFFLSASACQPARALDHLCEELARIPWQTQVTRKQLGELNAAS